MFPLKFSHVFIHSLLHDNILRNRTATQRSTDILSGLSINLSRKTRITIFLSQLEIETDSASRTGFDACLQNKSLKYINWRQIPFSI